MLSRRRSKKAQERISGVSLGADGLLEVAAELAFEHTVVMLQFLLLAQVNAVVGKFATTILLLTWRIAATLDSALGRVAPKSLKEQLHAITSA